MHLCQKNPPLVFVSSMKILNSFIEQGNYIQEYTERREREREGVVGQHGHIKTWGKLNMAADFYHGTANKEPLSGREQNKGASISMLSQKSQTLMTCPYIKWLAPAIYVDTYSQAPFLFLFAYLSQLHVEREKDHENFEK